MSGMRERVPALSLRPRPPYRVASRSAAHSGAATDRAAADMTSGDPSKDLRRALAANRAMQERCGRIEAERDSARSELQAASDAMMQFLDKWQQREEYIRQQEAKIRELQSHLCHGLTGKDNPYEEFRLPTTASSSRRLHTAGSLSSRATAGGGREVAGVGRADAGAWGGLDTIHSLQIDDEDGADWRAAGALGDRIATATSHGSVSEHRPWSRETGDKELNLTSVEKKLRPDNGLISMLRRQRTVARMESANSAKYDSLEVPVLSLAPRVASLGVFRSHMSEKIAYQSGHLFKEQLKSVQRSELLNTNKKLFTSIDMLVQVRLKEIAVETEDLPQPNLRRLAAACDLLDKLTATSSVHYAALNALRTEFYAAVFDDYVPPAESSSLPSTQQHQQRTATTVSRDYESLTPFFVEVQRLRATLNNVQEHKERLVTHLNQGLGTAGAVEKVIEAIDVLVGKPKLLSISFKLWADMMFLARFRAGLISQIFESLHRKFIKARSLARWIRLAAFDKLLKLRRRLEKEEKTGDATLQDATVVTGKDEMHDLPKSNLVEMALSWQAFAEVMSTKLIADTRGLLAQMMLPNVMDVRLLRRSSEEGELEAPHDLQYLLEYMKAAGPQEVLMRWLEMRVNSIRMQQPHQPEEGDTAESYTETFGPLRSFGRGLLISEGLLELLAGALKPFDAAEIGMKSKHLRQNVNDSESNRPSHSHRDVDAKGNMSSYSHLPAHLHLPHEQHRQTSSSNIPQHRRQRHHDGEQRRDDGKIAGYVMEELKENYLPPLRLSTQQLLDESEDHGRVMYVAHLFLHQPAMQPPHVVALRAEVEHILTTFETKAFTRSLYDKEGDGLHAICKGLVMFHERVRQKHAELIASFAAFQYLRAKIETMYLKLEIRHQNSEYNLRHNLRAPETVVLEVCDIVNADAELRFERCKARALNNASNAKGQPPRQPTAARRYGDNDDMWREMHVQAQDGLGRGDWLRAFSFVEVELSDDEDIKEGRRGAARKDQELKMERALLEEENRLRRLEK